MPYRRLQIPASDEAREALQIYADATNSTIPRVVSDLLDQAAPDLIRVARALEQAKTAPARALKETAELLDEAAASADQLAMQLDPKPEKKKG